MTSDDGRGTGRGRCGHQLLGAADRYGGPGPRILADGLQTFRTFVERVTGIEPAWPAWKAPSGVAGNAAQVP